MKWGPLNRYILLYALLLVFICGCSQITSDISENSTASNPEKMPAPIIKNFSFTELSIKQGEACCLRWDVVGADTVSIEPGIGLTDSRGEQKIYPDKSLTYVITAKNAGGITYDRDFIFVSNPIVKEDSINDDKTNEIQATHSRGGIWGYAENGDIKWKITDFFYYGTSGYEPQACQQYGIITNKNGVWTMIEITINDVLICDTLAPGQEIVYAKNIPSRLPVLKWKWKK
jgi:hypothetical protein